MHRTSPRRFVDLHTHTTASDGTDRPEELLRLADVQGLAAVAIADHDTADGLDEAAAAAAAFPALRLVNGVEMSAVFDPGTMHVLGLGVDSRSARLRALMDRLRQARDERNPRIISRLKALGLRIDMDDVLATAAEHDPGRARRIVGRLHIAETLKRKGYASDTKDAFDRLIGKGRPAFVDKERVSHAEAMECIRAAGGVAILAHPVQLRLGHGEGAQLERLVRSMKDQGLDGIEVYHSDHSDEQTRAYLDLALRLGLLVSGGSDYHGAAKQAHLGCPRVSVGMVDELLERIS
jgi:hypothetical protein